MATTRPRAAGELTESEMLANTAFSYGGGTYNNLRSFCYSNRIDPWALPRVIALTGGQAGRTPAGIAALLLKGRKNGRP